MFYSLCEAQPASSSWIFQMFLLFLLTRNLLTGMLFGAIHNKGQNTNSTMRNLDLAAKKADQEGSTNLSTLHLSRFLSFSSTKLLRKAFRHLLKYVCLETCYICCSPEHWEEAARVSHIPCCSGSGEVLASGREGTSKALSISFWIFFLYGQLFFVSLHWTDLLCCGHLDT